MDSTTTILFVRHGKISNPQQIYYGRLPGFPLSEEGCNQARAAATFINRYHIWEIYCSPLLRARQTAKIIAQLINRTRNLHISRLLNDSLTPFDGCPLTDVTSRNWDIYSGIDDPRYEQPDAILRRTLRLFFRIRNLHSGQRVVVVGHGDPQAFSILWAMKEPITPEPTKQFERLGFPESYPATASVSIFTYSTTSVDEIPNYEYVKPY